MGEYRHCCNSAVDGGLVGKQSKCNDLQGKEQELGKKAKDLKIVLKDSLRPRPKPRIPITDHGGCRRLGDQNKNTCDDGQKPQNYLNHDCCRQNENDIQIKTEN